MTSQTEKDKRIDAVADWLLEGMRYSEVLAKTCTEFKVCDRTARTYIGQANAIVREARMGMKEAEIHEAVDCLKDTYQSARRKDDHSAATGAVRELVKLLGLAEPDKTEVKHDVTDPIKALLNNTVNSPDQPRPRGN
jgi:hypothetical protein